MNCAFIPVRGGSKSIPKKNIKDFCGMPLVYWNIQACLQCSGIQRIVVATDDEEIATLALKYGEARVEVFERSAASSQDTSSTEEVMLEFLSSSNLDLEDRLILMQATSPFTETKDIEAVLQKLDEGYDSALSVVSFKRFLWNIDQQGTGKPENYDFLRRPRRQDMRPNWLENGALYVQKVAGILEKSNRIGGKIGLVEMPEHTAVEIDEPADWIVAEALFRRYHAHRFKVQESIKDIQLVLSDVDGVLTDAGMFYSKEGDMMKKFNTRDGMGFNLLQEAGIKVGIITSEDTEIVAKRAQKLKVDYLRQGHRFGGKLDAAKEICALMGIGLKQVAYIGDDINCKQLLEQVGFAACPSDASEEILRIPGVRILSKKGGEGCFRELAELVLRISKR
jgi:YrbI family 3-deoxy-D-manno-octulosonate 8-phosphate phosphatase